MLYTGDKTRERIRITWGGADEYFDLQPFVPEPGLVEAVNRALTTRWPLLITGDDLQCLHAVRAIMYELYGKDFPNFGFQINIDRAFRRFRDHVYFFDHKRKKRDLKYHRLDPENHPLLSPVEYLYKGPVLRMMELQTTETPLLEVRNVQHAKEGFVTDLMEFFLKVHEVKIPETGEIITRGFALPFIIMTAAAGFELPPKSAYDGTIYTYQYKLTEAVILENARLTFREILEQEPQWDLFIQRYLELFFLINNATVLNDSNDTFPHSYYALVDTMYDKWNTIASGQTSMQSALSELEMVLQEQHKQMKGIDVSAAVAEMKVDLKNARFTELFEKMEAIQPRLPGKKQAALSILMSRYHDLHKMEMLATESNLILIPQKNKLTQDTLDFLDELA